MDTTQLGKYTVGQMIKFPLSGIHYLILAVDPVKQRVQFARPDDLEDTGWATVTELNEESMLVSEQPRFKQRFTAEDASSENTTEEE